MIRDSAREFAQAELAPRAAQFDQDGWIADSTIAKLGELGCSHDGAGRLGRLVHDYVAYALAIEEIAAAAPPRESLERSQLGGLRPILKFGSDAQKQRYLPDMAGQVHRLLLPDRAAGRLGGPQSQDRAILDGESWC